MSYDHYSNKEDMLLPNCTFGREGIERKLGIRLFKGGSAAAPPPAAAPRRGEQQAKQVSTVKREEASRRVPGRGATILTKTAADDENINRKKLTGE